MKNPTFKIAAAAMMVAGAFATQTYAAGFQLSEQSAIQMGRAMAGAGVVGDDLSAVHYNPAGMTLLSGTRMQATGTWVAVNLDYEGDSGQSENGRLKGQIIPAGFITHQINDSLWAGLGLTVPYGMGTEFGEGWEGRERGTESMILTFDINPNLAWKVNDKLSVGGGISLQYAKAELGMGMGPMQANVKGDSWAWGWNVGLMFQPVETVRLGLAYRSHIAHNAEGHTDVGPLNLTSDMKVRIKTPDTVTLSATWEATDALRLSSTARWSKWSNFRTLDVQNLDFPPPHWAHTPTFPSKTTGTTRGSSPSVPTTSSTASGLSAAAWPTTRGLLKTSTAWPSFPTPTASGSRAAPPTSTRTT